MKFCAGTVRSISFSTSLGSASQIIAQLRRPGTQHRQAGRSASTHGGPVVRLLSLSQLQRNAGKQHFDGERGAEQCSGNSASACRSASFRSAKVEERPITDDHLFMEQGTVAASRRKSGGGTGRRSAGPGKRSHVHRWTAEAHNFVRFAREFKKRPRGERVDDHKRDWKGCVENPIWKRYLLISEASYRPDEPGEPPSSYCLSLYVGMARERDILPAVEAGSEEV
jgi:hypothetical protein